ncbi:SDR family oxidoreductase [Sphingosinicella sp. BN140058]|uniref:SDR family oxidoreductase n=1 Tax=Sphingosinicella sp. BN140058 TaxID=1892855 RepID=UPI001012B570|nr:SDR family oxidoreductase [Sphingosinicella sp. BN140058]QAY78968.1 SDR family oxidoreductase [Sphingosinicella sp. BN140058]
MKIVVIGGTGLIGSKTTSILRDGGHEVIVAAPETGVNTITGEGVADALRGADVVIDLANTRSLEPSVVLEFFEAHESSLLAEERKAGVKHHVVLSIVGADRSPDNGYFRAKVAQESLIRESGIPYTIVRSTQFMEFLQAIADSAQQNGAVHIATGLFQPIAADDVAAVVAEIAGSQPLDGTIEIAGPDRAPFNQIVGTYLARRGDDRPVLPDPEATYFGGRVERYSLVPVGNARLGRIKLADWMERTPARRTA